MKMIFATDVDGTILTDQGVPHKATNPAFNYARSKNNNIVIATGRALSRTKPLVEMMPDVNYLICNNGALIKDVQNKKVMDLHFITPKHYLSMMEFAKNNNFSFTMHTDKQTYTWPNSRYDNNINIDDKLNKSIIDFINSNPNINTLENGESITQLSLLGTIDSCAKNFPTIQKMFQDVQSVFLTNGIFIDVNPLGISKWTGLKFLANALNIDSKNIVTFGDSGNDLEMLQEAGENGFPMKNSTADLIAILPTKIGDNNSDAIAKKIIELVNK